MATIITIEETDFVSNSRTTINDNFASLNTNKQEVIAGKSLSTEDFTTEYKDKLVDLVPNYSLTPDLVDSIQSTLNEIAVAGGGILYLLPGLYTLTSDIYIPSGVNLVGTSREGVIIDGVDYAIYISTDVEYTTGTITSITGGVTVVGAGTSWVANATAGVDSLYINGQWMPIATVIDDTHIILGEGYDGPGFAPGASYKIATVIKNVEIKQLTFINSSTSAIKINNARFIKLESLILSSNLNGLEVTYSTELKLDNIVSVLNTFQGISITNGGRFNFDGVNCVSNSNSGFVLDGVRSAGFSTGTSNSNGSTGFIFLNCIDISLIQFDASGNGSRGINCSSNNSSLTFTDAGVRGNAGDGLKLTATTDVCTIIGGNYDGNGGYGINIAANTCDNNILMGVIAIGNSTGSLNDSGTGTLKSTAVNILP